MPLYAYININLKVTLIFLVTYLFLTLTPSNVPFTPVVQVKISNRNYDEVDPSMSPHKRNSFAIKKNGSNLITNSFVSWV